MKALNHSSQTAKSNEGRSLGEMLRAGSRESVEAILEGLDGANITCTVRALNKAQRGSYFVLVKQDAEYNEVTVKLFDSTRGGAIATGYVDRGHTQDEKYMAAQEVRGLVRAYLCR